MQGSLFVIFLLNKVESLVTQDDLELDTIDSQEIVYDDNSSDNSDCQVNIKYSILDRNYSATHVDYLLFQGLAVLPGVVEGLSNGRYDRSQCCHLITNPFIITTLLTLSAMLYLGS